MVGLKAIKKGCTGRKSGLSLSNTWGSARWGKHRPGHNTEHTVTELKGTPTRGETQSTLTKLKGTLSEDVSWSKNIENVQIFPSFGFVLLFSQHGCSRNVFFRFDFENVVNEQIFPPLGFVSLFCQHGCNRIKNFFFLLQI